MSTSGPRSSSASSQRVRRSNPDGDWIYRRRGLATLKGEIPDMSESFVELPVLPLRNLVLFPGVVLPVDVGRPSSLKLVDDVVGRGASARLVVTTQRDAQRDDPGPTDLHPVGVE